MHRLSSLKPFLFNAYYSWLLDNDITPHLLIDATIPKVKVPMDYVKNGNIILSLSPTAIGEFQTLPRGISFKARFKGVAEDIFVPYIAMEQLIALETGSALPIGKALEQLDLSPEPEDADIYPDEGLESEGPDFELDEGEESSEPKEAKTEEQKSQTSEVKSSTETSKEPGFSFVDE
ncbi:stringent starvation protein B [Succinivibrio dextrinosolvens]|uniref:stringent starvation protein B n=1 Tax=Succinivibrio dextrinosolvens TaxID=83771 RepID=UPI0008E1EBC5|nr:ClpXP protease specificity-enhancing factor SspB [Succinivibrio dextrinosolvens]SFS71178.1 stringent starvation protein B [Succinivibrio dextrinosolvens]